MALMSLRFYPQNLHHQAVPNNNNPHQIDWLLARGVSHLACRQYLMQNQFQIERQ